MRLDSSSVSFGRHESFPIRFGWISKGLTALTDNPEVFKSEDATVTLGVGKNMVSSMRYWLRASRIIQEAEEGGFEPTPIGRVAFHGGDPSLEDEGTIWLLHWLLATNPAQATSIYWYFNFFHKPEFTPDEVIAGLTDFVHRNISPKTSAASLKNDAQLLLRMYTRSNGGTRVSLEEALDSPLATLNLQERLEMGTWRAAPMARDEVPLSIAAFAITELFEHTGTQQLTVEQLMYSDKDHCALGSVFRMTEDGLIRKLEALCEAWPDALRIDRTAGVYQLYKIGTLDGMNILEQYYTNGRLAA